MKAAKVKFKIVMEYETTVTEQEYDDYPEDNMGIVQAINYQRETLQEYREDLYSALDDSKLVSVTVEETEHYKIPDKEPLDYQI